MVKAKGDESFKNLKFEEAISFYEKAMLVKDSDRTVLNSNISASYYELGNYEMSLKHSEQVKTLISNSDQSVLKSDSAKKILEKNVNRINKCNSFLSPSSKLSDETKSKWQDKLNMVCTNLFIYPLIISEKKSIKEISIEIKVN
jgi:tetratricopeptide (TPR) repeat protein